tara:strand:+ start:146 stop:1276 length:1131 start_codon:yes stop_codon:yes gene_type:complete
MAHNFFHNVTGLLQNPIQSYQNARQPGGLLAPVTSMNQFLGDPRVNVGLAIASGSPIVDAIQQSAAIQEALTPEEDERRIVKGADGFNYYEDGTRVLPDVTKDESLDPTLYQLVDANDNFVKNVTEQDFITNIDSYTSKGFKLTNIPTGTQAAGTTTQKGNEAFAPFKTSYDATNTLISELNNYAETINKSDDLATLNAPGAFVQGIDSLIKTVGASSDFLSTTKETAEYQENIKGQAKSLEGTDFSAELERVSGQFGVLRSQVIDLAYLFAAARGQTGRGLSDKDFQNALQIVEGGVGKEGKLAVISNVASRLRRQMSDKIQNDIAYNENLLKAGIDVEDILKRYKALPDLTDFVNPLEAITEEGEPKRIRIKVQ